jgi:nitrate reductase gamma subunit
VILIRELIGFGWPGLPSPVISITTVMTLLALLALLINRLTHPVQRFLSTFQDYLVWTLTFLPVLTGYMAFHHMLLPYPLMLAMHILSVELLMIVFPFTKLMHTFTTFMARWYTGFNAGHKGVQA